MKLRPSRRCASGMRLCKIATLAALTISMVVGSMATDVNAQRTRLVPLGAPQDEPARKVSPAQGESIRDARSDSTRHDQGWGSSVESKAEWTGAEWTGAERRSVEQRGVEAPSQVVRRIAYERPLDPVRVATSESYDVRQAAYQPSIPADTRPSLAPGSTAQPSGSWSGSSSVPMTSPSNVPSFSPSPWTSSPGVTSVSPDCSTLAGSVQYGMAPFQARPTQVQRFAVTNMHPCAAPVGVPIAGSVPVVQAGFPPLLPITRPPRTYFVSSGLLGQPVIYAPGQPVRNFFRYFTF